MGDSSYVAVVHLPSTYYMSYVAVVHLPSTCYMSYVAVVHLPSTCYMSYVAVVRLPSTCYMSYVAVVHLPSTCYMSYVAVVHLTSTCYCRFSVQRRVSWGSVIDFWLQMALLGLRRTTPSSLERLTRGGKVSVSSSWAVAQNYTINVRNWIDSHNWS